MKIHWEEGGLLVNLFIRERGGGSGRERRRERREKEKKGGERDHVVLQKRQSRFTRSPMSRPMVDRYYYFVSGIELCVMT